MNPLIQALLEAQDAINQLPKKVREESGGDGTARAIGKLLVKAIKANGESPAAYEIEEA